MGKKKLPERPIEISKLIDKYIEKGGMTTYPDGMLLPDISDQLGLSLETIGPDLEKGGVRLTGRTLSLGIIVLAIIFGAYVHPCVAQPGACIFLAEQTQRSGQQD